MKLPQSVRKDIARVLTFINTGRKEAAREANKKSGWKHLDLREKKTRTIRRKLTAFQRSKLTLKERKRQENFPQRSFAIAH